MSEMNYKGYSARVEYDDEDGVLFGRLAGIQDVITFHAESVEALKAAFQEAVEDYLATCARIGKKPEKSYSGQMMLRIDPTVHAKVALAAELSGKSLNQWSEDALAKAAERKAAEPKAAPLDIPTRRRHRRSAAGR